MTRTGAYLRVHREAIAGRNVAKRDQANWYRTIDRIHSDLLETPKILVPDIKGEGVFVIDEGSYYPHHNLYFITSGDWDLRALQAVLRSSLSLMTIATYCTRMSGGFPRGRRPVHESGPALLNPAIQSDPRPPFLAWLMLLEESEKSTRSVKCDEPHFQVFEEFRGASYARRYQILCERLVERQLYSAAALELTPTGSDTHRSLSSATSIRNLFAEFAGRMLAATQ